MCGFLFAKNHLNRNFSSEYITQFDTALNSMQHRGPDEKNIIEDNNWICGHVRLSIIDIVHKNMQPMKSSDGRYVLAFNGEIYNYKELKKTLENDGVFFKTSSDTEVLFNLIIERGIDHTLSVIKGMFSFIFFDTYTNLIIAARDPFGQKPIYFMNSKDQIIISSTVNSIVRLSGKKELNLTASLNYLSSYGLISEDDTFIESIKALPAGHVAEIRSSERINIRRYFDVINLFSYNEYKRNTLDDDLNRMEKLDFYVNQAIDRHLVSDVPTGIFLSGGIDSSLVLHYASNINPKIKAFTKISSDIESIPKNIVPKLQKKYAIDYKYLDIKKNNYVTDLIEFIKFSGSPSRWGGGPPMNNLSMLARQNGVHVILGGDGIDEYCGGYDSHVFLYNNFSGNIDELHAIVDLDKSSAFYNEDASRDYLIKRFEYQKNIFDSLQQLEIKERYMQSVLLHDLGFFLQACNLPHSDSYSMQASIELRNPFLDLDLVKYIVNQSITQKINQHPSGYSNKFIFRKLAENKIGNWVNVKKEGTRNYSKYISNKKFWNFSNFAISSYFDLQKTFTWKEIFKIINLEIFYRSILLNESDFLDNIITDLGYKNLIQH